MAKVRGNGEGCIRKYRDKYWEARITIGVKPDGKPKIKTFYGKTYGIVQQKLDDFKANKQALAPETVINCTVGQWLLKWLDNKVVNYVKLTTRISYEGIINNYLIPHIGHIKLKDLKRTDVQAMYNNLVTKGKADGKGGLSVKTVKNIGLVLHKALEVALEDRYIVENVAHNVKVPTLRSEGTAKKEIEVLSKDEQKTLIAACGDDIYGTAIYTIMFTGLRLGEALGLQWNDFDFEKNVVTIRRQVNRLKDYSSDAKTKTRLGIQNDTKTSKSQRTIPICQELADRLKAYKTRQDEHIKSLGKLYHNQDLVFCRDNGFCIDPSTLRSKYYKILEQAGLKHFTVHALRHTFATRAIEAGEQVKVVSDILGHSSVQFTMDVYAHALPEYKSEAMNRIAAYIGA